MKSLILFLIAIFLPILALLGIFWDDAQAPVLQRNIQTSPPLSNIVPPLLENQSQQKEQRDDETDKNTNVTFQQQPEESPQQEEAPFETIQKILTDDGSWEAFITNYYTKPATLPTPTYLTSSSNLFFQGIRSPALLPVRNWQIPFKDIDGLAVLAVEIPENKILYNKDIFVARPIASISKLMTALVTVENLSLTEEVLISKAAVETVGEAGRLAVDETLTVQQLLHALLLESSNDAAVALEEAFNLRRTEKKHTLIHAMNEKAKDLSLDSAAFEEPTGLNKGNRASAYDVALLMAAVYQNETLRDIMALSSYETRSKEGIAHRWVNSNSLLGAFPGIVAGKTGYTEEAGECMVIVTKLSSEQFVITVILGSTDRVRAMTNLISWVKEAYLWE